MGEANTRHLPSLSTHLPPTIYHPSMRASPSSQLGCLPPKATPSPSPRLPRAGDPTDPMTAKAGSSCRSKGKSIRKLVLKRAVMVTTGRKGQGSWQERHRRPQRMNLRWLALRIRSFLPLSPASPLLFHVFFLCTTSAPWSMAYLLVLYPWSTSQTKPSGAFLHCPTELPSTPHGVSPYSCASTPGLPLPASLFHTASTRKTKALNVAAKNPRQ